MRQGKQYLLSGHVPWPHICAAKINTKKLQTTSAVTGIGGLDKSVAADRHPPAKSILRYVCEAKCSELSAGFRADLSFWDMKILPHQRTFYILLELGGDSPVGWWKGICLVVTGGCSWALRKGHQNDPAHKRMSWSWGKPACFRKM